MHAYPPLAQTYANLEALADAISESLESQVTIEDENHNVMAYSSHRQESDSARISTIIGRRVPDEVTAGLRKAGILQQLETSDVALRIPAMPEIGLGPRLTVCIKNHNSVLGYIWIVDTGRLIAGEAERVAEKAADIAKLYLLRQRSWGTKQRKLQDEFFWKLLTTRNGSAAQLRQEAQSISVRLPDKYWIVIHDFGAIIESSVIERIRNTVSAFSTIDAHFLMSDRNQLIGLYSHPLKTSDKGVLLSFIKGFIEHWDDASESPSVISAGCSRQYDDYGQAWRAYQEALSVLEMKKRLPYHTRDIFRYDDMGVFADLPAVIELRRSSGRQSPLLMKLREHDQEHKADLNRSLSVYLSCNTSLKEAASILHVHVNTLTYRLNRIAEITGLNLRNTNTMVSIYLDLLVEEHEYINQIFSRGE
ncbi:PucR family transcriptional regulator [Cohnella phaseoli]|uniref:DNA-binding PucR family transcriptional regulator n=1 Tax=Cohnella phaseoli TaxID=456490 RepID=A0A3D9IUG0_9BACL|nr:helix-turn-helix domain-containing protein [Cohnella phaseoli]RED65433.1 DNA-binding PucR family transcriptional regulator [Cohnella phaseoli]